MHNNPLITVIVPVYKVEKYLDKCVESIVGQTYANLEIILVDDGSPDDCGKICDSLAQRDSRIKVLHKENGGLSSARNAGLDVMHGDYVGFVDSDDWIAPDMFEYLLSGMTDNVSVSICNYYSVKKGKTTIKHVYDDVVCSSKEMLCKLFDDTYENFAWNKLYMSDLWKQIRFPVGKNYEDMLTIYKIIELCDGIRIMPEAKYYYLQREDSITGLSKTHSNRYHMFQAVISRYKDVADRMPEMKPALFSRIRKWYCRDVSRMIVEDEENREYNWDLLEMLAPFVRDVKDELYLLEGNYSRIEKKKINAFSMCSLKGCKKCLRYNDIQVRRQKQKKEDKAQSMMKKIEAVKSEMASLLDTKEVNPKSEQKKLKEIYKQLKDLRKTGCSLSRHEFMKYQKTLTPVLGFIKENINEIVDAVKGGKLWRKELQLMSTGSYSNWKLCKIIDVIRKLKDGVIKK